VGLGGVYLVVTHVLGVSKFKDLYGLEFGHSRSISKSLVMEFLSL
jgi:hypothetical protein